MGQEAGWAPEPIWTWCLPGHSLVIVLTELSRILFLISIKSKYTNKRGVLYIKFHVESINGYLYFNKIIRRSL